MAPVEASRRRRTAAGLIDGLLLVCPQVALQWRYRGRESPKWVERTTATAGPLGVLVVEVLVKIGVSPGARLAGVVCADPLSGRRMSAARATLETLVERGPRIVMRRVRARGRAERSAARRADWARRREERQAIRTRYAHDAARRLTAERELIIAQGPPAIPERALAEVTALLVMRRLLRPLRVRARGPYVTVVRSTLGE